MRATIVSLTILLGLTGCAADVTTGEDGVVAVEKAALERDVHFLDLASGSRPLEATEARSEYAVPVVLRFHEDVAVAWWAPEGEAQLTREGFVAFWPVQGHAASADVPAYRDGTVAQPGPTTINDPDESSTIIDDDSSVWAAPELPGTLGDLRDLSVQNIEMPFAIVDWLEVQTDLKELPPHYHPGCE